MKDSTKQGIHYLIAIALIVSGIAIAYIDLLINDKINGGTLTYVGEAFSTAGILLGFGIYIRNTVRDIDNKVQQKLNDLDNKGKED